VLSPRPFIPKFPKWAGVFSVLGAVTFLPAWGIKWDLESRYLRTPSVGLNDPGVQGRTIAMKGEFKLASPDDVRLDRLADKALNASFILVVITFAAGAVEANRKRPPKDI
jgi:hypothetical protein